jgi:uncharacterized damage-inducible protein DinB
MPGQAPFSNDERELLLSVLAEQRDGLRNAAFGLTDAQARSAPSVSSLSVASLLRHVITTERSWMSLVQGGPPAGTQGFELAETDTLAGLLDGYRATASETEEIIAGAGLDDRVPVPESFKAMPWFRDDIESWPVRWVLLHLIEETARHAGHADIVRESVDGATSHALMATIEGWPANEWLQPWQPPSAIGTDAGDVS